MYRRELTKYHSELAEILKSEPDRSQWKEFLEHERTTPEYKSAKEQAGLRNLIKPILPEVVGGLPIDDKTKQLVDRLIIIIWSKEALNQYNDLPKRTVGQIKETKKLIRQTAAKLLENPQDINNADEAWRKQEAEQKATQDSQEAFSALVKRECLALIKEKWKDVAPGQLAQLVRISSDDNDPSQDFAKDLLSNYFKGPPNRCFPRVVAYCNFVSATLDLVGEDEAFLEGMKIVLYATDILPRDPSLIEQLNLLCLPSKEEEKGGLFQKLLIIESVTKQAISMSSQDFTECFQGNENFKRTNEKIKNEWYERKKRVTAERGANEARIMSNKIVDAMNVFLSFLREPLSEERKQSLMHEWPYSVAFDETDPLNQKFQKVLASKG